MRTKRFVFIGIFLVLLAGLTIALADSNIVQENTLGKKPRKGRTGAYSEGELDWSTQIIKSTGFGVINPKSVNVGQARLGCLRAATVTAQRNLLEIVQGVNIDSETTVENFMTTSDVVKSQVRGVLRGAQQIGDPVYKADGTCEITLGMRVTGDLSDVLLPPADNFGQNADDVPDGPQKIYTGLIIDATLMGAVPAMAPKVLDPSGEEVYGSTVISREYAVEQGVVGYAKSVNQAKDNPRVAPNPLVIKALKVSGKKSADVVISDADATKLRDPNVDWQFLKECKVIIVL